MREPESQSTFDAEFNTSGMDQESYSISLEEVLISLRKEAVIIAGEWLVNHGYFNGIKTDARNAVMEEG